MIKYDVKGVFMGKENRDYIVGNFLGVRIVRYY